MATDQNYTPNELEEDFYSLLTDLHDSLDYQYQPPSTPPQWRLPRKNDASHAHHADTQSDISPTQSVPLSAPATAQSSAPSPRELQDIQQLCQNCVRCLGTPGPLSKTLGEGNQTNPKILILTHYQQHTLPAFFSAEEQAFIQKWFASIQLNYGVDTYTTTAVKCFLPEWNAHYQQEHQKCLYFLDQQIDLLRPNAILTLGEATTATLLGDMSLSHQLGKISHYSKIPVLSTYHPANVLADTDLKRYVWYCLKLLNQILS